MDALILLLFGFVLGYLIALPSGRRGGSVRPAPPKGPPPLHRSPKPLTNNEARIEQIEAEKRRYDAIMKEHDLFMKAWAKQSRDEVAIKDPKPVISG